MQNGADDSKQDDDRSSLALGYAKAARVFSIGIEMVIPILLGVWLDWKLGTVVLFLLLGVALGMGIAVMQLVRIAQEGEKS